MEFHSSKKQKQKIKPIQDTKTAFTSEEYASYSKTSLNGLTIESNQNTLVFAGEKKSFGNFSSLYKLLNEFDQPPKQVRVRVKIAEIFGDNTYDRELTAAVTKLKNSTNVFNLMLPSNPDPKTMLETGIINVNPFFSSSQKKYSIESGLAFLDSYGKTRTLSDTDQLVTNGEQAQFKNIVNVPYPELLEGKTGFLEATKYRETGATITVTPFANEEGFITIKLDVKSGEQTGYAGKEQRPVFREADVISKITIRSGMPYLAANSVASRFKSVKRSIPLFSQLPLFKEFLSSRSIENNQSQLLCFVEADVIERDSKVGIMRSPTLYDFDISNSSLKFEDPSDLENKASDFKLLLE